MHTLAVLTAIAATEPSPIALPAIGVGIAVIKLVMTLLDKGGALAKLPAWLRPWVTVALAAGLAFLEHLHSGGGLAHGVAVAVSVFAGNELWHSTAKGAVKKSPAGAGRGLPK